MEVATLLRMSFAHIIQINRIEVIYLRIGFAL